MKRCLLLSIIILCASCAFDEHDSNTQNLSRHISYDTSFSGIYHNISVENYDPLFHGDITIAALKGLVREGKFTAPLRIKGIVTAIGNLRGKPYTKRAIVQDESAAVAIMSDDAMPISVSDIGRVFEAVVLAADVRFERVEITAVSNVIVRDALSVNHEPTDVFVRKNMPLDIELDGQLSSWHERVNSMEGNAIVTLSAWGCPDIRIERFRLQGSGVSVGSIVDVIAPLTRFYNNIQADFVSFFPGPLDNHLQIESVK